MCKFNHRQPSHDSLQPSAPPPKTVVKPVKKQEQKQEQKHEQTHEPKQEPKPDQNTKIVEKTQNIKNNIFIKNEQKLHNHQTKQKTPPKVPEKSPIKPKKSSKPTSIQQIQPSFSKPQLTPSTPQLKKQQKKQQKEQNQKEQNQNCDNNNVQNQPPKSNKQPELEKLSHRRHLNTKHINNNEFLQYSQAGGNNMPRMRYESTTSAESLLPDDSQLKSHSERNSKRSKHLHVGRSGSNVKTENSKRSTWCSEMG